MPPHLPHRHPSYARAYLRVQVDGNQHCYTNEPLFYTTGPLGITAGATEDSPGTCSGTWGGCVYRVW
eukprot:8549-Eustigmatos_ZCMA.PRE.1